MIWLNGYFKSSKNTNLIYKETDKIFNIDYMNWSNDRFPDLLKACKENKIIYDSNPYSFYQGLWKVSEYSDNEIILFYETIFNGGLILSIMFNITPTKMEETTLTQIRLTSSGDGTKYLSDDGTYNNKVLEVKTFNIFKKSGAWVTDKDENLYNYVDNYLPLIMKLKPTNYTFTVNKRYSAYIQSLDMTVPVVEFICIVEDGSELILDFVISKEWNDKYNTNMKDYIVTPLLSDIN